MMDSSILPRRGVAPCAPIRTGPDGYGSTLLLALTDPAFLPPESPEPRQQAAPTDPVAKIVVGL